MAVNDVITILPGNETFDQLEGELERCATVQKPSENHKHDRHDFKKESFWVLQPRDGRLWVPTNTKLSAVGLWFNRRFVVVSSHKKLSKWIDA